MGSVLSRLTKAQVADNVKSLGDAFLIYEAGILSNGIGGSALSEGLSEEEISEIFDLVGVTIKTHRRVIKAHFLQLADVDALASNDASANASANAAAGQSSLSDSVFNDVAAKLVFLSSPQQHQSPGKAANAAASPSPSPLAVSGSSSSSFTWDQFTIADVKASVLGEGSFGTRACSLN